MPGFGVAILEDGNYAVVDTDKPYLWATRDEAQDAADNLNERRALGAPGCVVNVIDAIGNCLEADASLIVSAGGEGVFHHIDSVDCASATLIVFCNDGNPYEVRVRRVTEADCEIDSDGIIPPPIVQAMN